MNEREFINYLAGNGFDIPLSDNEIKSADDEEIKILFENLSQAGRIVRNLHPIWTLLECLLDEMHANDCEKQLLRMTLRHPPPEEKTDSLSSMERILSLSPQYGSDSCIFQEFRRCRTVLNERVANRLYPGTLERLKEIPTPSWLLPGSKSFNISGEKMMTRDAVFGVDFSLCNEYLKTWGLIPVCDTSVASILLRGGRVAASHPEYLEIFEHVVFAGMHVLNRLVKEREDIVWISCGTQFGLPLLYPDCKIGDGYTKGRFYGVVSASALNGGYGAVNLHTWRTSNNNGLGEKFAEFRRGVNTFSSEPNSPSFPEHGPLS